MKSILKKIFRSLPFKKPFIYLLRALGGGYWLPDIIKEYLVFEGNFKIAIPKSDISFVMQNGYGRQIEVKCFWNGFNAFEPETINLWRQLVLNSRVILDIGANTGIYSLIAKSVNPNAAVYAFEPLSRIHRILERNLDTNKKYWKSKEDVLCFHMAVSDFNGIGKMYDLPVEHMYTASLNKDIHLQRGNPIPSITESVSVKRLDTFCDELKIIPDLIKIDVESHEPEVLRGLGDILKHTQVAIICEIWDNTIAANVQALLDGCGYRYFQVGEKLVETLQVRNDDPSKGYINYLFLKEKGVHDLKLNQ